MPGQPDTHSEQVAPMSVDPSALMSTAEYEWWQMEGVYLRPGG